MAEKLSWTELRKALATRADVSEKTAGVFLSALTAQLTEGLRSDKQVKINGLGTFKLQAVAPRKSVNVSTGEEFVIEGYNKVVFSPEAGVKELVEKQPTFNSPAPDPIEGDFPVDPIKKLGEQADEIVGLLADLGQDPNKTEDVAAEPEPVATPEPAVVTKPEPEAVAPETPKKSTEKPEKKYHFVRDLLICVVVLLLLLGGGYFFLRNQLSKWLESLTESKPVETEQVEPVMTDSVTEPAETSAVDLIPEGEIPQQQILDEFMAISNDMEMEEAPYSDLITTEEMHEGSRLTWMAKRFYGDKRFWPYLYDANRDRIDNPSNIEIGTPIRVPRLTQEQMDTTNRASMEILDKLRIEAEAACKK
ncbi:MAG: HU family DNA-binding protein [Paludibacteraceae bacterium]|nr:HU family DNA-binding protein [Paludibacteraceae bacterium]